MNRGIMEGREMEEEKLLDILVRERMGTTLNTLLSGSQDYQNAMKKMDEEYESMKKINLSDRQYTVIDRVISSANHCGAVYGEAAYKLGLQDGARIVSELKGME